MSLTPTYPGVYIQEIPSGNQSVTPVSTSITAFIGRAPFGSTTEAMSCFSYADFTRLYGGLSLQYPMSYAVRDFFNNGGAQALILRLFEPIPNTGTGVAQLPFPPSPPLIPEGWMLAIPAAAGATTLQISQTAGGEGEPEEGMAFVLSPRQIVPYLVTGYTGPTAKVPTGTVTFTPPLSTPIPAPYPICTPVTFSAGPTVANWVYGSLSSGSVTIVNGTGIPELGDTFSVAGDTTVYTITQQPQVTVTPTGAIQLAFPFSPPIPKGVFWQYQAAFSFSPPMPTPMPVGWQISSGAPTQTKAPYSISVVNGLNGPLPGDTFTIGSGPTMFLVTGYTPATGTTPAQILFSLPASEQMPPASAFCFCCSLNFTRPAPQNFVIKPPQLNGTSMTITNNNGAATGVVDVGYSFSVPGDDNVYTIVIYNQSTGAASFLPEAASAFPTSVNFSPPLQLVAASPGDWGNSLTASVDTNGITAKTSAQFAQYGLTQDDLFNLTLTYTSATGQVIASERYLNLSVKQGPLPNTYPNRIDYTLEAQSMLAAVGILPLAPPGDGAASTGSGGSDGQNLSVPTYLGDGSQTGMYRLGSSSTAFNMLCIPPDQRLLPTLPVGLQDLDATVRQAAAEFCTDQRAIYIADPLAKWETEVAQGKITSISPEDLDITGMNAAGIEVKRNVAVYFPRIYAEDMLLNNMLCLFPACGMVAGVIAATDVARGVWKSPAGTDAGLAGVATLATTLNDTQNGVLNPKGINCLRNFPLIGPVVWGARTLMGADQLQDDYKYLSVRRLTLFIESSLFQSTQWAVFEPNDESLWSALRLSVNSFLADLARQGAFYNYLVTCDSTTTTPTDIANGVVNILVQIAPVKPAEFVVITIQQTAATASS